MGEVWQRLTARGLQGRIQVIKHPFRFLGVILMLGAICVPAMGAHIGKVSISRIRHWSPGYAVVWLDKPIANPPSCATVLNKIVVTELDTAWGRNRLSMLLTAMVSGYKIDSNCTDACQSSWDGQITVCREVSIER